MPAQLDLAKQSVRQFAERFRSEMIPLSNTFSYFCASVPMSEEDLKEYLEEPVAALPPAIAAALPLIVEGYWIGLMGRSAVLSFEPVSRSQRAPNL